MPRSFWALTLNVAGQVVCKANTSGPLTLSWWINDTAAREHSEVQWFFKSAVTVGSDSSPLRVAHICAFEISSRTRRKQTKVGSCTIYPGD